MNSVMTSSTTALPLRDMSASIAALMSSARAAQSPWAATPIHRRLELVRELRQLIAQHASVLAAASASEFSAPSR